MTARSHVWVLRSFEVTFPCGAVSHARRATHRFDEEIKQKKALEVEHAKLKDELDVSRDKLKRLESLEKQLIRYAPCP
jgi:hypothetical protein